jgi:hypothetical protein
VTPPNERFWHDNPNYTPEQRAFLDEMYLVWIANGRNPVVLDGDDPLYVTNTPDDEGDNEDTETD